MGDDTASMSDDDIRTAIGFLQQALGEPGFDSRRELVGRAARSVTRMWALANPDFDSDAWYPVSYLLTEHWSQIRRHMTDAD